MQRRITFILIILCFLFSLACSKPQEEEREVEKVPVTVIKPEVRDIIVYYDTSATIQAEDVRNISFPVAGKIVKFYKEEGQQITEGEILAELDRESYQNSLKAAESNLALAKKSNNSAQIEKEVYENELENARIHLEDMEREYERFKRLYEQKVATKTELEKKEVDYKQAKNDFNNAEKSVKLMKGKIATTLDGIDAAEAQYNMALKQYKDGVLTAPFDGTIFRKYLEEGAVAGPGTPVLDVVAKGLKKVEAALPERYLTSVSDGSNILLTIPNNECDMKQQQITRVHPEIDPQTGTFGITIDLKDVNGCIRHGMFAQLKVEVDRENNVLSIPIETVLELGDQQIVYTVQNNVAKKTVIETGLVSDKYVEILSGLTESDSVILSGNRYVVDDSPVKVTTESTSEEPIDD